jgi:hypothetical protein
MRKIGVFLLFLSLSAGNSFSAFPCKAENFPKKYDAIFYLTETPEHPTEFYSQTEPAFNQLESGNLEITNEAARPASSKKPNKLEYQAPSAYPEASKNYKGNWYQ